MRYVKKYIRFGTVQIEIRDYVPQRIVAAKETVKLGAGEVP